MLVMMMMMASRTLIKDGYIYIEETMPRPMDAMDVFHSETPTPTTMMIIETMVYKLIPPHGMDSCSLRVGTGAAPRDVYSPA
jgi:hypothetical protein